MSATKLYGSQTPTYEHSLPAVGSYIEVATTWLLDHGIILLPWQTHILNGLLSVKTDAEIPEWAARVYGALVPRQQGKTELICAYLLVRFYLFNDRDPRKPERAIQILYTALTARSVADIHARLTQIIDDNPDLKACTHYTTGKGHEQIKITKGPGKGTLMKLMTRTVNAARGTSVTVAVFDECQSVLEAERSSISMAQRAAYMPQTLAFGTPPDPGTDNGDYYTGLRNKGRAGKTNQIWWVEWAGPHDPDESEALSLDDRDLWVRTNPSLGFFLDEDTLEAELEQAESNLRLFESQSVCLWPNERPQEELNPSPIDFDKWVTGEVDPLPLDYEGDWVIAAIVASDGGLVNLYGATRPDEDSPIYVENFGHFYKTDEVKDRYSRLKEKLNVRSLVIDKRNAVNLPGLEDFDKVVYDAEVPVALERFLDELDNGMISHPPTDTDPETGVIDPVDAVLKRATTYEWGNERTGIKRQWTAPEIDRNNLRVELIRGITLAVYGLVDPNNKPKAKTYRRSYK